MGDAHAWRDAVERAVATVEAAQRRARAHPLSRRKALLAAVLLDNLADDAFELMRGAASESPAGAEDVLAYRSALRGASPALALVFDLCSGDPEAPTLSVRTVPVPIEDYPTLPVEDFMVSLYNANTVQRLVITDADGKARPALALIDEGLAALKAMLLTA